MKEKYYTNKRKGLVYWAVHLSWANAEYILLKMDGKNNV